jgi:hypothetical protein
MTAARRSRQACVLLAERVLAGAMRRHRHAVFAKRGPPISEMRKAPMHQGWSAYGPSIVDCFAVRGPSSEFPQASPVGA